MTWKMISGENYKIFAETFKDILLSRTALLASDNFSNQFSGTYFAVEDRKYIVTAKHCLQAVRDYSTIIISSKSIPKGRRLKEPIIKWLEDVDLALIEIPTSIYSDLQVAHSTISDVDSNSAGPGASIYMVGFPSTLFQQDQNALIPKPWTYISKVSTRFPSTDQFSDISRLKHFFVEYDENNTRDLDKELMRTFPLQGISGTGVFTIVPCGEGKTIWDFSRIRLAGIQSTVNRSVKLLQCVRSEQIVGLFGGQIIQL